MNEFNEQLIKDEVTRLAAGEIFSRDKLIVELENKVEELELRVGIYEREEEDFREKQSRFRSNKRFIKRSVTDFIVFALEVKPRFFKVGEYKDKLVELDNKRKRMEYDHDSKWAY